MCLGVLKNKTELLAARATWPVSLGGSLSSGRLLPGASEERGNEGGLNICSPASQMGKGRVKGSDSHSKPPPAHRTEVGPKIRLGGGGGSSPPFPWQAPASDAIPHSTGSPPARRRSLLLLPNASADTPRPRAGPVREGELRGNSSILHELFLTTFQRVCAIKHESVFSRREEQLAGPSFSSCIVSSREKTARDSLFRLRKGS